MRVIKAELLALSLIMAIVLLSSTPAAAAEDVSATDKTVCLGCHGNEGFSMPAADGTTRQLHVPGEKFEKSVHGAFQCTMCHQDITAVPHSDKHKKVDCGMCHADQKAAYLTSVHGQENAK